LFSIIFIDLRHIPKIIICRSFTVCYGKVGPMGFDPMTTRFLPWSYEPGALSEQYCSLPSWATGPQVIPYETCNV